MAILNALHTFRLREFNRNVRLFFGYGIAINAGMALFTLLYNLYLLRLSYQEDFIGQVAGMAPLATGLFALPIGMLSDRLGRRPFLMVSSLLLAVSQLGMCLSSEPLPLLVFSFLGGIATGCIWVNHVPFLSDNAHPTRRAEALALWSALQVVVRMLWSLVGGFMPGAMGHLLDLSTDLPDPFRYALLLGALCSLVSFLPLLRMPARAGHHQHAIDENPQQNSGGSWHLFAIIAALSGTRSFALGLTYPFFNVFFEEELDVGAAAIGTIFFLSQLAGLPATFSTPWLVRRFGPTLTILPVRTGGGLALGFMGLFINLPVAVSGFLISRAAEVVDNPVDQHFSTQVLPRQYWARIQGFRVCGFQLCNFVGSVLGGVFIIEYGYWAAFGLAGAARVASGLIMASYFGLHPTGQKA